MPSHTPAAQLADKYSKRMPGDLGPQYARLFQHVAWLHANWATFRYLFVSGEDRVGLLNDTASFFFKLVSHALRREIILGICRLTDPATSGRQSNQENLSLEQVVLEARKASDSKLADRLTAILERLRELVIPMRKLRHKILAHSDLPTVLGRLPEPLQGVRPIDIQQALKAVATFMDAVQGYYCNSGPNVTWEPVAGGGADHLVIALEKARQAWTDEEAQARRQAGIEPGDDRET